jgi:hypothetical protein
MIGQSPGRATRRIMRPSRRGVLSTALTVILSVLACGCRSSEEVVATIGAASISETQLRHWSTRLASLERASTHQRAVKEGALRFLIRSAWLTAQARQLDLQVPRTQVLKQLEFLSFTQTRGIPFEPQPRDPVLRRLMLDTSESQEDREWLIGLNLLEQRVEHARTAQAEHELSARQVATYYARHKSNYREPAVSNIEIIGNNDATIVRRARREIEAGASFVKVARRASEDPEAHGGLQRLVRGAEEPAFEKEIFGARPHVLLGPIHQELYYIFTVLSSEPDRQETLAQASPAIRHKLAPARSMRVLTTAYEAASRARTRCRPRYVVPDCGRVGL